MKALLPFAIYMSTSAPMQSGNMARQTQGALFRSRAGALRQQRPSQLTVWLKALATSTLVAKFAAYRPSGNCRPISSASPKSRTIFWTISA